MAVLQACKDGTKSLSILSEEQFVKNILTHKDTEIIIYEGQKEKPEQIQDLVLLELKLMQPRKNLLVFNSLAQVGLPLLHVFKRSMTLTDLKL